MKISDNYTIAATVFLSPIYAIYLFFMGKISKYKIFSILFSMALLSSMLIYFFYDPLIKSGSILKSIFYIFILSSAMSSQQILSVSDGLSFSGSARIDIIWKIIVSALYLTLYVSIYVVWFLFSYENGEADGYPNFLYTEIISAVIFFMVFIYGAFLYFKETSSPQ